MEITREKVLQAAKTSIEAEKVLRTLFPEVFSDPKCLDLSGLAKGERIFAADAYYNAGIPDHLIEIRKYGEFKDKGFYLDSLYTWEIVEDDQHSLVLIPTKYGFGKCEY